MGTLECARFRYDCSSCSSNLFIMTRSVRWLRWRVTLLSRHVLLVILIFVGALHTHLSKLKFSSTVLQFQNEMYINLPETRKPSELEYFVRKGADHSVWQTVIRQTVNARWNEQAIPIVSCPHQRIIRPNMLGTAAFLCVIWIMHFILNHRDKVCILWYQSYLIWMVPTDTIQKLLHCAAPTTLGPPNRGPYWNSDVPRMGWCSACQTGIFVLLSFALSTLT